MLYKFIESKHQLIKSNFKQNIESIKLIIVIKKLSITSLINLFSFREIILFNQTMSETNRNKKEMVRKQRLSSPLNNMLRRSEIAKVCGEIIF